MCTIAETPAIKEYMDLYQLTYDPRFAHRYYATKYDFEHSIETVVFLKNPVVLRSNTDVAKDAASVENPWSSITDRKNYKGPSGSHYAQHRACTEPTFEIIKKDSGSSAAASSMQ